MRYQISGRTSVAVAASLCFGFATEVASSQVLAEVGFDADDFMVSLLGFNGPGGVIVLDADLSVKGRLASSPDALSTGLDFDPQGRLVARVRPSGVPKVAVFEPGGQMARQFPDFAPNSNGTLDLKVTTNNTYVAASQNAAFGEPNGLLEYDRQGNLIRTLDVGPDYEGVAVLSDGTIWAGGGSVGGFLNAFDPVTGTKTELFQSPSPHMEPPFSPPTFDGGQSAVSSMTYDASTDTVLLADRLTFKVFERATDGTLLNTFPVPGVVPNRFSLFSAIRGPGGEVFAALDSTIYRFADDGSFLDETVLDGNVSAANFVWAGNASPFVALPGDYNGDGQVDAADYTVWADHLGSMTNLAADGNGDGVVDAADYTVWADSFGTTASINPSSIVPEPGIAALVVPSLFWVLRRRPERSVTMPMH
ncbi:MAG: dockerin type I repeat-containing protein [Planctomycetota bacterium]